MKSLVSTMRAAAKSKILRLAAGGLFVSLLSAYAWAYPTWNNPTHLGASCPYGISHSDASCLHGWWDNTPPASTGVAGGSTFGLQSMCSDWGSVYGRVSVSDGSRYGYRLTSSSKKRGYDVFSNVNSIRCCPNKGELCHQSQVKKLSGNIKVWNDSTNSYDRVDVSTRTKRQHFCAISENRDGVYCRNNLDGDALKTPYNCNDHYCTTGDCEWAFEQSDAYDSCTGPDELNAPSYTISATDGTSQTCTVTAYCAYELYFQGPTIEESFYRYKDKTYSDDSWDLKRLVNCMEGDDLVLDGDDCD